ncbi:MAG: hypothetical protein K6E30_00480 [Lachnospiraceae bacterium]|nr:hypothetical protein [Lachnospiraceae bacterium]
MSKFLKMIVNLFLIAAIVIAVAILVPPLMGITTTIIDSAALETNLPLGSVTYSEEKEAQSLASGDKILKEDADSTYAYIIVEGDADSGKYMVIDPSKNDAEDVQEITIRNYVSSVVLTIPYIGYVMVAMHSTEGMIIIGLVILFVVILFILSELWKKRADDDEDEDEEDEEETSGYEALSDNGLEKKMSVDIEDGAAFAFEEPGIRESVRQIVDEASVLNAADSGEEAEEVPAAGENAPLMPEEPVRPEEKEAEENEKSEQPELPADGEEIREVREPARAEEEAPDEYEPEEKKEPFGAQIESELPPYSAEDIEEEEDGDMIIPVERLTLEEIVEQVKRSGAEPSVRRDPVTGIEIVDLSEIL